MIVGKMYKDLEDGIQFSQPGWFDTGKAFDVRLKPETVASVSWRKCVRPGEALNVTFEAVRSGKLLSHHSRRGRPKDGQVAAGTARPPRSACTRQRAGTRGRSLFEIRSSQISETRGYLRFWIRVGKDRLGVLQMTKDNRNPEHFQAIDYYAVEDGEGGDAAVFRVTSR